MNLVSRHAGFKLEPVEGRLRAIVDGETIADSRNVLNLREGFYPPVYYFPLEDVRRDLLVPTARTTHCGLKGEANYYSIRLSRGRILDNAVWQYARHKPGLEVLADRVAFYGHFIDEFRLGDG